MAPKKAASAEKPLSKAEKAALAAERGGVAELESRLAGLTAELAARDGAVAALQLRDERRRPHSSGARCRFAAVTVVGARGWLRKSMLARRRGCGQALRKSGGAALLRARSHSAAACRRLAVACRVDRLVAAAVV